MIYEFLEPFLSLLFQMINAKNAVPNAALQMRLKANIKVRKTKMANTTVKIFCFVLGLIIIALID